MCVSWQKARRNGMKELNALTKEHEKLKDSHASLVSRYENFSFEQPCATNSIYCVAQLEKVNCELKAQLEDLTSKHVALQENMMISHAPTKSL
jgi:hypothetical protein